MVCTILQFGDFWKWSRDIIFLPTSPLNADNCVMVSKLVSATELSYIHLIFKDLSNHKNIFEIWPPFKNNDITSFLLTSLWGLIMGKWTDKKVATFLIYYYWLLDRENIARNFSSQMCLMEVNEFGCSDTGLYPHEARKTFV